MTFGFIFILGFSGLLFLAPKNRTKYAYDGSNWLTRVDYPNGQIIKYAYNGAGDRVGEQIGNDVVLTSSYDAAGRLLSRGSDTFGYDADGNLINAVEGEVPASYTWNSDNRLTMVSRVHNGCKHDKDRNGYGYGHLKHGSSFVEYEKYDYLPEDWRRITRTAGVQKTAKNKKPAVEEEVFVSIYDGSDESHEYRLLTGKTASLQLEQSYISDPGTDDMNFTLSAGKTLTMLKDGLGSTVSLTGNDGKVLAKIGYDAWGRFMWPTEAEDGSFDRSKDDWSDYLSRLDKTRSFGKHNAWAFGKQFADRLTPYLYTGRRFSAMTGEYWNRHRYYSPALGRFTSKDPIGFNGGMNLFRYADNNPMRWVDPWGLYSYLGPKLIYGRDEMLNAAPDQKTRKILAAFGRGYTRAFPSIDTYDVREDCCTVNKISIEMYVNVYIPLVGEKVSSGMGYEELSIGVQEAIKTHETGHVLIYKFLGQSIFDSFEKSINGKSFQAASAKECKSIVNAKITEAFKRFFDAINQADKIFHLDNLHKPYTEIDWSEIKKGAQAYLY